MNNSNQFKFVDLHIYDIESQPIIKTINPIECNKFLTLYHTLKDGNVVKYGTTGNINQRINKLQKTPGIKFDSFRFIHIPKIRDLILNELHQMLTNVPEYNIPEICQKLKIINGKDVYFDPPEPVMGKTIQIRVPVFENYVAIPKNKVKYRVRKDKPGIYELWEKLTDVRPRYIGSSIDLQNRLLNHEISYNYVKMSQDFPEAYSRIMAELELIITKRPSKNKELYYFIRQDN